MTNLAHNNIISGFIKTIIKQRKNMNDKMSSDDQLIIMCVCVV